jgi:hypothetical protein
MMYFLLSFDPERDRPFDPCRKSSFPVGLSDRQQGEAIAL